ncbi:MAG: hypothetical protein WAU10_00100 [Caldilineaceae bacterium]
MKNFLAVIGVVALLIAGAALYAAIAPLLGGVDALTLTNDITQTQAQPQTVYIVATPTLAPAAPVQVAPPPEPVVPTAVPPAAPTSAPSPVTQEEQFALDCAAGKAAGRRVSPLCPSMAAQPLTVTAPTLAYCFQGDGWTPEYRATVSAGFNAWAATGIAFVEDAANCQTAVVLTHDASDHAGHGGAGLIDFNLAYGLLPQAAIHEVGHILGLPDSSSGAMNGVYMIGSPVVSPTIAEIATVRRLWGME